MKFRRPASVSKEYIVAKVDAIDAAIAAGGINEEFEVNGVTVRRTTVTHVSGFAGYTLKTRLSRERYELSDRSRLIEDVFVIASIPTMTNQQLEDGLRKLQAAQK